jgi:uncharacterized membrane protein YdjX (TVP38/TMEM64 family)
VKVVSSHWLLIVSTVLLLLLSYLLADYFGLTGLITDLDSMVAEIRRLGVVGPFLVIALMALAVVFNPLPSAPVALASGAVYGHSWGTIYIIIGATLGAVIAFLIARISGYQAVRKLLPANWFLNRGSTQSALMFSIFISRLIPFLSFDLISYAAGLTPISLWRYFLATLFGLMPASFLLAHFGGEMRQADLQSMTLFILLTGLVASPVLLFTLYKKRRLREPKA